MVTPGNGRPSCTLQFACPRCQIAVWSRGPLLLQHVQMSGAKTAGWHGARSSKYPWARRVAGSTGTSSSSPRQGDEQPYPLPPGDSVQFCTQESNPEKPEGLRLISYPRSQHLQRGDSNKWDCTACPSMHRHAKFLTQSTLLKPIHVRVTCADDAKITFRQLLNSKCAAMGVGLGFDLVQVHAIGSCQFSGCIAELQRGLTAELNVHSRTINQLVVNCKCLHDQQAMSNC